MASPESRTCPACGTGLDAPEPGPARVGSVVKLSGGLRSRYGLAVAERAGSVVVLAGDDGGAALATAEFDGLPRVDVPGPGLFGAAGRMWSAALARQAGRVKGRWPAEAVESRAAELAAESLGTRRATALDCLALDLPDRLPGLGLSPTELHWYGAWHEAAAGPVAALLDHLEALPPTGYPDRVALLLRRITELLDDPRLRARAHRLVAALGTLEARALADALDEQPGRVVSTTVSYAYGMPEVALHRVATAVSTMDMLGALPPAPGAALAALDAYAAGVRGYALDAATAAIAVLPEPLLDEMVEVGALSRVPPASPWPPATAAYLRCRTDPGGATVDDLLLGDFPAELARRHFLAGDRAALAAMDGADPAVAHYQALSEVRTGGRLDDDRLRADARKVLAAVQEVLEAGSAEVEVPDEVAADPTCWTLVGSAATTGRLRVSSSVCARHPDFGAWLGLHSVRQLAFDGRWPEVRERGRELARSAGTEPIRDEALNMVAFAEWQSGNPVEALRVLDEALAGEFTTGLMVNAALVAAEQGSDRALGYLVRVVERTGDRHVRRGALARAVALWLADPDSPDYPPALADLVRGGLAEHQEDDAFHRELVRLSARFDAVWLARERVVTVGAAQAAYARYQQARSRWIVDSTPATLAGYARGLLELWTALDPRPDWVVRERDDIVAQLDEAVHVPFGKAADLTPAIDVLLAGGDVLPLVSRLVLAAQAGAHTAESLSDQGDTLSPEAERRLLLDPVDEFGRRWTDLATDHVREAVGNELGRCLAVAAIACTAVTADRMNAFVDEWNALIERERWDSANRAAIRGQERRLIDQAESWVRRCRAYVAPLGSLPLEDGARSKSDLVGKQTATWTAELTRLRGTL